MAKQVKDVYGNALFEVALEENKIDEYCNEAGVLLEAISENHELVEMMTHPQIHEEEKLGVLKDIFESRLSPEMYGLLVMIAEKGHFADTQDVLQYFLDRVKAHKNIGVAYVKTPMELSQTQRKEVEKKLLDTTDYVSFEMHYDVDESLIGGMVIRIGDRVVDSSIKTKLERMSYQLSTGR